MRLRRAQPATRSGARLGSWLLLLVLLTGCAESIDVSAPAAGPTTPQQAGLAQRTVTALAAALATEDSTAARQLGSGTGAAQLAAAAANVGRLGLSDLSMRYIDAVAPGESGALDGYGPNAFLGTVEVTARLVGWDPRPIRVDTPMVFVADGARLSIAHVGGSGGRTPLWLDGPVTVRAAARALVISRSGRLPYYGTLLRRAVRDVNAVLPDWTGRLVLEVPGSEEELDQALDADQPQYAAIAAVTASVDGSLDPGSPVHVFLNPRVFDRLGPRGAQVVISHESTHVATGATFSAMPIWLLEGFADYVALDHAGIPVATAASQILARVRQQGPPDHLPTEADLSPTATGLGATYEEAWLATRFIAVEYGESALIRFYRAVDGGLDVDQAFRQVLGTTQASFVARWRADLRRLSGAVAG